MGPRFWSRLRWTLGGWGVWTVAALSALGVSGALPGSAAAAAGIAKVGPDGVVTRYDVGAARQLELGPIAAGADGNVWVVAARDDIWLPRPRMLRITPAGGVTQFTLGTAPDVHIAGLTAGSDGNVWFSEGHASRVAPEPAGIGRITPSGNVTEFSTGAYFYNPRGIAAGPDGNLWMTDWGGDNIVRVNPSGQLTDSFHITAQSSPWGITSGPDGNLWFTEQGPGRDRVARITTSGDVSEFSAGIPQDSIPTEIAAGADGRLWFVQASRASVGRVTTSGSVDQIPVPLTLDDITTGPDGNVYATGTRSYGSIAIGGLIRISPAGSVTEIPVGPCSYPESIAAGPDGNVWFTDDNASGCPPFGVDVGKHGTIDRRGIARVLVLCRGGDLTVPCEGVAFRLTATVRYKARGPRGGRVPRKRTVTIGATRLSIGGPPTIFGRVSVAQIKLTRAGRRLLARSSTGTLRVRVKMRFGSARRQREMILAGPKPRKADPHKRLGGRPKRDLSIPPPTGSR